MTVFPLIHLLSPLGRTAALLAVSAVLLFSSDGAQCAVEPTTRPDVLILVLGSEHGDKVAINYTSVVPDAEVDSDVARLIEASGWRVENVESSTDSGGTPDGKPTTSITLDVPGGIAGAGRAAPVEAFAIALKRFASIQVNCLSDPNAALIGPEEFENEYVRIQSSSRGNGCTFDISIKTPDFERLNLPGPASETPRRVAAGWPVWLRAVLAVFAALIVAAAIYSIGAWRARSSRRGQ